jgi:dipeptidyl aminopeptidase/acylaminoacyl peptidase
MLAARRPVACVISQAGPTDLRDDASAPMLRERAEAAFADELDRMNPIDVVADIRAPVLQAVGAGDALVPVEQLEVFADALRAAHADGRVETMVLASGPVPWVHVGVTAAAEVAFRQAAFRFADALVPVG